MDDPYKPPHTELKLPPEGRYSMRFWRNGLLYYNGAQLFLTLVLVLVKWPKSRILFTSDRLGSYLGFAVIANLLYCSAIVVEGVLLVPFLRPHADLLRRIALVLGILLACGLAGGALTEILFSEFNND